MLPLGYAGDVAVDQERQLIDKMLSDSRVLPTGAPEKGKTRKTINIEVPTRYGRVTGQLTQVYGDCLIDFQFARDEKAKYLAPLWLPLLAWHATSAKELEHPAGHGVLVLGHWDKDKPKAKLLGYDPPDDAAGLLAKLVSIYLRGIREPIPLFPHSSWKFAWTIREHVQSPSFFDEGVPDDPELIAELQHAHDNALNAWFEGFGESDMKDEHIARTFEGQNPLVDPNEAPVPIDRDFARMALTLWGPLCKRRVDSGPVKKWLAGGTS